MHQFGMLGCDRRSWTVSFSPEWRPILPACQLIQRVVQFIRSRANGPPVAEPYMDMDGELKATA